jgi:L-asparaginase
VIHILFTGGTISMRHSAAAGGAVPALGAADLAALAPGLDRIGLVELEDWGRFPAAHLDLTRLWNLRNRVAAIAAEEKAAGIVVTHGTDTIEETAYLLARTVAPDVPVVVTGAMRTSEEAGWDGGRNIVDSARVAAEPASRGRGAMVVLNGTILSGLDAVKTDAGEVDTFQAPRGRPLGSVTGSFVRYTAGGRSTSPLPRSPTGLTARVALVQAVPGDTGVLLDSALPAYDGLVLVGFGRGNVPPAMAAAAGRWLAARKPVVLATRCAEGEVLPLYGFEGGGAQLIAAGALPAGRRAPSQAWMELLVSLSAGLPFGAGMETAGA